MQIQIDSREKARAIKKIINTFENEKVRYFTSKLYVGDYMSFDNPRLIVDRKQNLGELCGNICQGHEQFIDELNRANEANIKLIFLVEHSKNITCLEDVRNWINPRLYHSPKAMTGERLYKSMTTIEQKYGAKFDFCAKNETGKKIIELLS